MANNIFATEKNYIIENYYKNFENSKDFLPGGLCGSCRRNLSYRFGQNPSPQNYKPFPCETDEHYYQKVIDILGKLPRGSGENQSCTCFICDPAHTDFFSTKLKTGPKPEFSNQTSRDNRSLDQSREQEVDESSQQLATASVHERTAEGKLGSVPHSP